MRATTLATIVMLSTTLLAMCAPGALAAENQCDISNIIGDPVGTASDCAQHRCPPLGVIFDGVYDFLMGCVPEI